MKLKTLFIVNAIVVIFNGISAVLAPNTFISLYGATLNPAGANMMQFGGVWLIGIGLLTWFVRNAEESETRRGIILALLIMYILGFIVALLGLFSAGLNALGWSPVGINAVFALGYGCFWFAKPKTS